MPHLSSSAVFVEHVHLYVSSLSRSIRYYEQVIGFRLLSESNHQAVLTADGRTPLLTLEQPADVKPKSGRTTGLYHFALLLPSREDLACFIRHAHVLGIRMGSADHLVSEAVYLEDPDQNGIEMYCDRPREAWKWQNGQLQMTVDPLNLRELSILAQQKTWQQLPSGTQVGHIHLHVAHLSDTELFYTKGLGLDLVARYGSQAIFVSSGGYHHHLGLNTWQGVGAPAPEASTVGLKHFTIHFPNEKSRQQVVYQLSQMGVDVRNLGNQIVVYDPSQHEIHLTV